MFPPARRRTATKVAAGLAVLALGVSACGDDTGGGAAKKSGDTSTLVAYTGQSGGYQVNFNPFAPTLIEGPGTIFEPLFYFNNVTVIDPVPRLGTEFKWNADGTKLDVTLRDNATFSDGTKFTANDVVFTFNMIKKFPAMNQGGFAGDVKAVDPTHVTFTFKTPSFMDAPQVLGKTFIVPEHLWKDKADPSKDVVEKPVGTGPYMLADFKAEAFTLKSNPTYWGGEPALKQIRYLSLSGNQAGADALKAGKIDWQTGPVPDIKNVEKNYPGYSAITVPLNQTSLFTCSNAELGCEGPQTELAVRKAIYYAIDRTQVNALAFENTSSEVSPGGALAERDKTVLSATLPEKMAPMTPQVDKSTALLEGAGWTKGADGIYAKNGKKLQMTVKVVSGWTDYITAVDTIGQQLKKVGIAISAQQLSWNEWADARDRGKFQLLIDSLQQGPAPDPYYLYQYYFAKSNTKKVGESAFPNASRFVNPQVESALAALKAINPEDAAKRQPHFDALQAAVAENIPYIPVLTGGTTSEFNTKKFTGWPTKDNLYAFPAIWARPDASQVFMQLKPAS